MSDIQDGKPQLPEAQDDDCEGMNATVSIIVLFSDLFFGLYTISFTANGFMLRRVAVRKVSVGRISLG